MLRFDQSFIKHIDNIHYTGLPAAFPQPFGLTSMGIFGCGKNYFTDRDGLNECLILYTLEGWGKLDYMGQQAELGEGSFAVINCNNRQYYATGGEFWKFAWIHLHGDTSFSYERLINKGGLNIGRMHKNQFMPMYKSLKELTNKRSPSVPGEISICLHSIVNSFISAHTSAGIEDIADFLSYHFSENIDVEQLASRSGFSKYYFIKLFKAEYGTTPHQYITALRINEAKKLLTSTNDTVSEIAQKTGFSDSKGLIFNFKSLTGTTPLKYRRNYR